MAEETKKTIEFYEKVAQKYAEKAIPELLKHYLEFFIKHIKGKKILDVGCGSGRDSKFFHDSGFEARWTFIRGCQRRRRRRVCNRRALGRAAEILCLL